ncbi:MAG: 50S ribosomal protein L10 [Rickettsiales bacterium]|jgi:large subunit ribosomal protein L10|nr:50S ribosomal protein L10 [Rickettsiales bacterium]
MKKQEKQGLIETLNNGLSVSESVVVAYYRGMTVSQIADLRKNAKQAGVSVKVSKNTLAKIALKGTKFEGLGDNLKGPTLIAFGPDVVAPSKVLYNYSKENGKLQLIAGATTSELLDDKGILKYALLPTMDEARAGIAMLLKATASKMAMVLDAKAKKAA